MLTEFFFSPAEVSFNRAERPFKQRGDFAMRKPLLKSEVDGELLVRREQAQRRGEILAKIAEIDRGGIRGWNVPFGQFDVLPLTSAGVAPVVVRDPEQPGGERRCAAETGERPISLEERFLGEVVGQRRVALRQVAEELAHRGLMTLDQFAERRAIVVGDGTRDQLGVGRHDCGARLEWVEWFLSRRGRANHEMISATPIKPGIAPT